MSMECVCACDYADETYQVWWQDVVTARKQHVCCECGETIEPGQKYESYRGLYDGYFNTHKTCIPCRDIRDSLCSSWMFETLREVVFECMGFDYVTGETIDDDD